MIYRISFILLFTIGGMIAGIHAALGAGAPGALAVFLGAIVSAAGLLTACSIIDWLDNRD